MDLTAITQASVSGILMGGVYGLMAAGLSLIFGVMGVINFAHGSFLMLGMYTSYWAFVLLGIDPYLSILVSLVVLFIMGSFVEISLIKPVIGGHEHGSLLVTLGLWLFLDNMALFLWSPNFRTVKVAYGTRIFVFHDITFSFPKLMAFFFAFAFSFLLYLFLKKTHIGKAIRAISDEKIGAMLMGINVKRMNWITFGIGIACAGIAGSIILPFFHVEPAVGDHFVIMAFIVVVFGGLGSFIGSLLGGLVLGLFESWGAFFLSGSLKLLVTYLIFLLVLLFRPTGLFGKKVR